LESLWSRKKTEKKNALSAEEKLKPVCMWQEHTNAKNLFDTAQKADYSDLVRLFAYHF